MEKIVVKTDRRYRRNLFTAYIILIVIGVILARWGIPAFRAYLDRLPIKARVETIETTLLVILALFIPAAIYLIVIGRKVCAFDAMPYPGMKVIHDTVVVTGKRAQLRGWSMVVLGVIMILMVIASGIATHTILLRMKHSPFIRPIFYGNGV